MIKIPDADTIHVRSTFDEIIFLSVFGQFCSLRSPHYNKPTNLVAISKLCVSVAHLVVKLTDLVHVKFIGNSPNQTCLLNNEYLLFLSEMSNNKIPWRRQFSLKVYIILSWKCLVWVWIISAVFCSDLLQKKVNAEISSNCFVWLNAKSANASENSPKEKKNQCLSPDGIGYTFSSSHFLSDREETIWVNRNTRVAWFTCGFMVSVFKVGIPLSTKWNTTCQFIE